MNSKIKKILFVTEKYCERGDRSEGNLTNNFHNTFDTADESGLFTREHLWIDELVDEGNHINNVLIQEIQIKKPDIIVFSYYGCDYNLNPAINIIAQIKYTYPNISLVHLWWDSIHPCIRQQIELLDNYTDLVVNFDATDLSNITQKAIYPGVPQSKKLFYPDTQIHDITFAGRTDGFYERINYLEALKQCSINLNIVGGRTQQKLLPEEYAKWVRQSKININFSNTAHGWNQIKGRVSECLFSKTLLFEQNNGMLQKYLNDGEHFISFNSIDEFVEKADFYLKNDEERNKIVEAGYNKWVEMFDSSILWRKIYEI